MKLIKFMAIYSNGIVYVNPDKVAYLEEDGMDKTTIYFVGLENYCIRVVGNVDKVAELMEKK